MSKEALFFDAISRKDIAEADKILLSLHSSVWTVYVDEYLRWDILINQDTKGLEDLWISVNMYNEKRVG